MADLPTMQEASAPRLIVVQPSSSAVGGRQLNLRRSVVIRQSCQRQADAVGEQAAASPHLQHPEGLQLGPGLCTLPASTAATVS